IQWDFLRELTCSILEMHQAEDWQGQHLYNSAGPTAVRSMILLSLSFNKTSSKFSTIVQDYVSKASRVFCIWKAFGRNTRDLGSFKEETDKTTDLHQYFSRISPQKLETASQITRDAGNGYSRKGRKTKPKMTKPSTGWKRQSQIEAKVSQSQKVNPDKVKSQPSEENTT
ncbi:hypothetical protein Tco_1498346, partial [Tanacetum coccineum]